MTLKNILVFTAITSMIAVSAIWLASITLIGEASAPSGLQAGEEQVTFVEVGPDENVIILTQNRQCSARIISTQGEVIRMMTASSSVGGFATSTSNLSIIRGLIQTASTTVVYDSGQLGCGFLAGFAEASTTITVIETF